MIEEEAFGEAFEAAVAIGSYTNGIPSGADLDRFKSLLALELGRRKMLILETRLEESTDRCGCL